MYQVRKSYSALTLRGETLVWMCVFFLSHSSCRTANASASKLVFGGLGVVEPRPPARDGLLLIVTIVIPLQVGANSWHCVELRL